MAGEKPKGKMFVCPHCEKGFPSISALNGHMGGCKARTDEPDEQEDTKDEQEDVQEEGITIFEEEDEDEEPERKKVQQNDEDEDDDDGYGCGACGHTQKRKFKFCPKCGVENEFD